MVPAGASRRVGLAVTALSFALGLTACGASSSPVAARITRSVELRAAYFTQFHATVLTDRTGYALYVFFPDDRRAVTCTGTCALTWPPLTVAPGSKPVAGPDVKTGLIGTDTAPNGSHVVTYGGWPLYTYTGDVEPSRATGQAIDLNGGVWYLIRPDGRPLTSAISTSTDTQSATL